MSECGLHEDVLGGCGERWGLTNRLTFHLETRETLDSQFNDDQRKRGKKKT